MDARMDSSPAQCTCVHLQMHALNKVALLQGKLGILRGILQ